MNKTKFLCLFVFISQFCSAQLDVIYNVLVWSDEIDSPGINNPVNPEKWHHQTQLIDEGSWANSEVQHYTNRTDNSFVENGFLKIVAKKENFTDQGYTKEYTSARLNSKFAFTYGRVDVRAKLPIESGTWPAIWTLGKNINEDGAFWDTGLGLTSDSVNWSACGEIDIMEHGIYPNKDVNYIESAVHTESVHLGGGIITSDVQNNFHVYSLNWSPNQLTFLIDDEIFYVYNPTIKNTSNWPFDLDQFILLNVAMGGPAGAIDPEFTESAMTIDYVRVFQQGSLNLNNFDISTQFKVFPNPANTAITINSKIKIDKVIIYNAFGKQILVNNDFRNKIIISDFISGIYFLEIHANQQKVIKKIVVYN